MEVGLHTVSKDKTNLVLVTIEKRGCLQKPVKLSLRFGGAIGLQYGLQGGGIANLEL